MAKRFDWDKVGRYRKVWLRQPWEDLHHFWRGYEVPKRKTDKKKQTPFPFKKGLAPKENGAILRGEFPVPISLEVPEFSKVRLVNGRFQTPLIQFDVLFLDYLAPGMPDDLKHRLLLVLRENNTAKDPFIGLSTFEKRLQFLTHLDSWRYDHELKHLELHFIPRKNIYRSASMIWPDIGHKE